MSGFKLSDPGESVPLKSTPAALELTVHSVPMPSMVKLNPANGRWKMLLVLACCAAPVVASYFTYFVIRPQGRSNFSELIAPQPAPPTLSFKRLSGEVVPASALQGQWLLAVASGGECDSRCENNLTVQARLRETLGREKDRVDKVWFITDQAVPRAATLAALQGVEILRVPLHELAAWLQPAPGQQLQDPLYIVDPMGQWMMRTPVIASPLVDPAPSAKVKKDLERLLRASASWDQPGRPSAGRLP